MISNPVKLLIIYQTCDVYCTSLGNDIQSSLFSLKTAATPCIYFIFFCHNGVNSIFVDCVRFYMFISLIFILVIHFVHIFLFKIS